jgi:hypothetical protein
VLTASHAIDWNDPMETVLFTQGGVVLDRVAAAEVITYKKIDEVDGSNADDEQDRPFSAVTRHGSCVGARKQRSTRGRPWSV